MKEQETQKSGCTKVERMEADPAPAVDLPPFYYYDFLAALLTANNFSHSRVTLARYRQYRYILQPNHLAK